MNANELSQKIFTYQSEAVKCTKCRALGLLHQEPNGDWAYPLFQKETNSSSGILFIAEAPNWEDTFNKDKLRLTIDIDGDPTAIFQRKMLRSIGLTPEDILVTNAVLCLPKRQEDGKYKVFAKQQGLCRSWLIRLIEDVDARIVVTFGRSALEAVGRIEKHNLQLSTGEGKLHDWFGRKLLPLYHPSMLGRRNRPAKQQLEDIKALIPYLS